MAGGGAPRKRWSRRKEARPGEVLDAAFELFAERGFNATRMDDIAARCGVSKGTVYLYFDSKEEIFKALVREAVIPNIEGLEQLVATFPGPAPALLREILGRLGALVQHSRLAAFPKLIIAESANFPDLARFYHDTVVRRGMTMFAAVLQRGIDAGEFRPIDTNAVSRLCMAPILFLAIWRSAFERFDERPIDPDTFVRQHAEALLHGIVAAPADPAGERES